MDEARIDSCTNCGECMDVFSTCSICEQPSRFQCTTCYHFVDDPIHTECIILDDI